MANRDAVNWMVAALTLLLWLCCHHLYLWLIARRQLHEATLAACVVFADAVLNEAQQQK